MKNEKKNWPRGPTRWRSACGGWMDMGSNPKALFES